MNQREVNAFPENATWNDLPIYLRACYACYVGAELNHFIGLFRCTCPEVNRFKSLSDENCYEDKNES